MIQHVKAGKVRILASWGDQRLAALPDVPTLSESGFNVVFFQWAALFAPAGTPEPVLVKLREAARTTASDPPELARFWAADAQKLAEAVKRVGKVE